MMDFTEVYAVPGQDSIIDMINPATGLTAYSQNTEEQIKAREPLAVRMSWEAFRAAMATRQNSPIAWDDTTAEEYDEMLGVLPPAFWRFGLFLVGEPMDHSASTGAPRFSAYWQRGTRYMRASRPMTIAEARATLNQIGAV